jgi:hypothetical protein
MFMVSKRLVAISGPQLSLRILGRLARQAASTSALVQSHLAMLDSGAECSPIPGSL